MFKIIELLVVPKEVADRIDYLLTHEPTNEEECMSEDETICYTKRFYGLPFEMDIKLCGVQYEEGNSNTPWCEAVLFELDDYGCHEVSVSDVEYEFFGKWSLEHDGVEFVVNVKKGE